MQQFSFFIFASFLCCALSACNIVHSDPNDTVSAWWYDSTPMDFEVANNPYYGDEQNMCQRYGRCTNTKGPAGGSKVSAARASGRSSSSSWSSSRK